LNDVTTIDGAVGGGQLLRTSIALSALMGKEIRMKNIRANRSPPGLKPQHITAVRAIAALVNAEVKGLDLGSTDLLFRPRSKVAGLLSLDVGTAGSVSLILQAALPVAMFAPGSVTLQVRGGTDVPWSPPIDYLRLVFMPTIAKMGLTCSLQLLRRGHYPKGGGEVLAKLAPVPKLKPIEITDIGEVHSIKGVSHCVKLPQHVAERQAKSCEGALRERGYGDVSIDLEYFPPESDPHLGPGSGIAVAASTTTGALIGADSMGERGLPAEKVGRRCSMRLLEELGTGMSVDSHLADMLIPYMAIADGKSEIRISKLTPHAITNVSVTEQVVGVKFEISGDAGKPAQIAVNGIGLGK